jgi:hypothetical protein
MAATDRDGEDATNEQALHGSDESSFTMLCCGHAGVAP